MTQTARLHVVVGLIRDADGRVLISQRAPGTHMAGHWEFPGGKVNPGEDRFPALRRELAEELDIELAAASPELTLEHDYGDRVVLLDVWLISQYSGVPRGREGQALQWVCPEQLAAAGILPADLPIVDWLRRLNSGPG